MSTFFGKQRAFTAQRLRLSLRDGTVERKVSRKTKVCQMIGVSDEIKRRAVWPTKVDAKLYNLTKRALARSGGELRLPMRGLKTLDLIVRDETWIIVDRALDDLPMAAWSDFQDEAERGLHEPVICELRYFHDKVRIVIKKVLRRMEEELSARLAEGDAFPLEGDRVIAFRPRNDG